MNGRHISASNLRTLAQVAGDPEKWDQLMRAAQALIEGQPFGASSLDEKLVDYGEGFKAPAGQRQYIGGVAYKRHIRGGGWVPVVQDPYDPEKAYISENAYIGPGVTVRGNTKIHGGIFCAGTFFGGTFFGGTFNGGIFCAGTFFGGTFGGGTFYGGTFYYGGTFDGGIFNGGIFYRGIFYRGTFFGGTFFGGTFDGGRYAMPGKTYRSTADAD